MMILILGGTTCKRVRLSNGDKIESSRMWVCFRLDPTTPERKRGKCKRECLGQNKSSSRGRSRPKNGKEEWRVYRDLER